MTKKWGIIAPGRIAHKFVHDLKLAPDTVVHAVASRSLERAAAFAAEHGIPHVYGSYEEILDCPDLDVVYIASPHSEHLSHALLCLENGIPVLCEKPLTVNLAQAQKLVEAARRNDTFLMEAIWTRFIPCFEEALRLVDEGVIGELKTVRADFGFKASFPPEHRVMNRALAGGALLDVGIYPLFLATQLFGKPENISAHAVFGPTEVDESCAMILKYGKKQMAVIDCSLGYKSNTEAFLQGETGTLHLHNRFINPQQLTLSFYDQPPETISMPYTGFGYYHEILEVNECLRQGRKESKKLTLDFSLQLMETMDGVRQEAGIVYPELEG